MKKFASLSFAVLFALAVDAQAAGPCQPNVALRGQGPSPDAQVSAPASTGVRSMSVQPSTAPVRYYYAPVRYSRMMPSYLLPKTDVRKFD
ncbi:MAG: hypothetical protein C0483_08070 [Pirellula sp.]|nr:hypothetical protein [Pirellula sp.]